MWVINAPKSFDRVTVPGGYDICNICVFFTGLLANPKHGCHDTVFKVNSFSTFARFWALGLRITVATAYEC